MTQTTSTSGERAGERPTVRYNEAFRASDFVVDGVSLVVPTLNEEGSVQELVTRIDQVFRGIGIAYEVIVVDDHSTDATRNILAELAVSYPVRVFLKRGERGKAYSLLEGFERVRYNTVAIIDADLQYPPEALPDMLATIRGGYGVVVANRTVHREPFVRKFVSRTFNFLFTRVLHGLSCDVQAGLKMFRRSLLDEMHLEPSAWTFDLAFLINARNAGHGIGSVPIVFEERHSGSSKVKLVRAAFEIGVDALRLRFARREPAVLPPSAADSMVGAGVAHGGKRFVTHTTLDWRNSAFRTFAAWHKIALALGVVALALGLLFAPLATGIVVVAVISAVYFLDVVFNLYLVRNSLRSSPALRFSSRELAALDERSLPVYSILCPLYGEANVVESFVVGLQRLDWPKDKLDVLLLLEEDDHETRAAVDRLDLPSYVRAVVVPDSQPKTKPKACNFGLALARGEYVVIYDAEDLPDRLQLKKAYLGFQRVSSRVRCLQAKLNYFNWRQNLLTRLFTAEYSLWFDVMLPGMQSIDTSIPLGGTSNHFRAQDLRDLNGWDAFNVTEDCDLGVRLFRRGFQTAIIDSVTLEEANSQVRNWIRQRSRWLKGYLQTYLVQMRYPRVFWRDYGFHALAFQFIVGGRVAFMLINPLMWVGTIVYFAARAWAGPAIEAIYPGPVLALGLFSLIVGNFSYFYYYMIGCAVRGRWELVKYMFLIPFYWALTSIAAYVAFYQLLVKPHYWEKTHHGLHEGAPAPVRVQPAPIPSSRPVPAWSFSGFLASLRSSFVERFRGSRAVSGGSVLVAAMAVSNVLNFAFNAFLGRVLGFVDLGLVVLVSTLWYVASQFLGALSSTVNHRVAYLTPAVGSVASDVFRRVVIRRALWIVLGLCAIWIVSVPVVASFFNLSNPLALALFTPAFGFGALAAVNRGWLHGTVRFSHVAALFVIEAAVKLLSALGLVWIGASSLAYLSIPFSIIVTGLASLLLVSRGSDRLVEQRFPGFPGRFFAATLLTGITSTAFLSLDVVLVKHLMAPELAGQYALLSLAGKIVYFLGALPSIFIITLVSRDIGLRRDPAPTFSRLLGGIAVLVSVAVIVLGPAGSFTAPLLFGEKALSIVPYLSVYVTAIGLFAIANALVLYHLARKRYSFSVLGLLASLVMAAGIALRHDTLGEVSGAVFAASFSLFASVGALHLLYRFSPLLDRFIFSRSSRVGDRFVPAPLSGGRRILIFNWRDMRHAFAGGAEVYIQRMAEQWAADGYEVTLFCGNDGASPRSERVEGVQVIRRGGFYLVYLWAVVYYFLYFRGRYDVIVDCHNGIPFFTPLFVREPVVCLVHHVHQDVFRRALIRPLALFAQFLERDLMPLVYRHTPLVTISDSSRAALEALGIGHAGISVVHPGIDLTWFVRGRKSKVPTVLYLGRLQRYKSVGVLLRAFQQVLTYVPDALLVVAGSGEDERRLRSVAASLNLGDRIAFVGRISEEQKREFLQRAWVLVNPSFVEGWGITTIEANACGTPVVASDVPGLRDSVRDQYSGYLVPYGDAPAFARAIQRILQDRRLRYRLSTHAYTWAQNFDERASGASFLRLLGADSARRLDDVFPEASHNLDGVVATPASSHES